MAFNAQVKGVEFNATRMEDIVANEQANMFRFPERLLCYYHRSKNPMLVLGSMPTSPWPMVSRHGQSMLIAAVATMLQERCEVLKMPFLFGPCRRTSSPPSGRFGRTRDRMVRRCRTPASRLAPIDDAENNLEERTQGVSVTC